MTPRTGAQALNCGAIYSAPALTCVEANLAPLEPIRMRARLPAKLQMRLHFVPVQLGKLFPTWDIDSTATGESACRQIVGTS